jgi:hypothetical protein
MLIPANYRRWLRTWGVLLTVVLLAAAAGSCGKKRQPREAGLHPIPAKHVVGDHYVNRSKRLRFPLPGTLWEYTEDRSFDLVFHSRDHAHMLFVEAYTEYGTVPSLEKVCRRFAKKIRGKVLEFLPNPGTETMPPYTQAVGQRVAPEGSRALFLVTVKPRRLADFTVTRQVDLFVKRERRRIYVFAYMAEPQEFSHLLAHHERLIGHVDLLER